MKKILFVVLFFIHLGFSQQEPELLLKLKNSFVAFEYEKTIALADSILLSKDALAENDLVEVLRMQAIAHFSLDNLSEAGNSFLNILEIIPNFTLSESETSPKIITFYNTIKLEYLSQQINEGPDIQNQDQPQIFEMQESVAKYKAGILRSLVFPGWGHYYIDEVGKGLILNLGSILTLAPGVFYAIQTEKFEKEYLNTKLEDKIESSYRRYNNAYKNRNNFLAAFAIIWAYSQYDYFFNDHADFNSRFQVFFDHGSRGTSPQIQFLIHF